VAVPLLVSRLPRELPRLQAIHLDGAAFTLVAGLVLTLAAVMAFAPSVSGGPELGGYLRSGRRGATGAQHVTRSTLVVSEVALAAMLLVSAGLLARSLIRLLAVDPGFDPSHLLTMEVDAVGPRYGSRPGATEAINAFHDRVRAAILAVPGVTAVATSNQLPLAGNMDMYGVLDPDNPPSNPELAPSGDRYVVSPAYLHTMRIPLLKGRGITESDAIDTVNDVVLVSAALADRLWPGQNPLGRHVQMGGPQAPIRRVIGVTGNVKHRGLDAVTTLQWYAPPRQWLFADNNEIVIVRTSVDPASIAPAVRRAIASVDPTAPVIRVASMDQVIAKSTAQRRLALALFSAFAAAALLLSVAGIYGVLAGSVAERTREIGLRSALGATPAGIVSLVVWQGGRMAVMGLVIGLLGAAALTRYLRTLMFGIGANDPVTLGAVVAILAAAIVAACLLPAMRAVRIDPSEALRSE
ncbi:MAG TPA: FtsX-like permease family protein, partial [Gemmatimonadaceae bacterium]